MMSKGVVGVLTVAMLSILIVNPSWQASGNMTGYLLPIRGYIDAALADSLNQNTMALNLSDSCNNQWDQFWNVFVAWLGYDTSDIVMYGYAFRAHWYWHNNYDGRSISFIIWKDYNCDNKNTYTHSSLYSPGEGDSILETTMNKVFTTLAGQYDTWVLAEQVSSQMAQDYAVSRTPNLVPSQVAVSVISLIDNPEQVSFRSCQEEGPFKRYGESPQIYYVAVFMHIHDS